MKERDDDDIIDNQGEGILKEDNINNIKYQNSDEFKLPTIDTLIDVNNENKLTTVNSFLKSGDIYDEFDTSLGTEEEENEVPSSTPKIVYICKDYIFNFSLLMSSSFNYSILYFPYILLGFVLTFFLSSSSKKIYKFKKISEIMTIIYSLLLLIFKIVLIILTKKDNEWVNTYENIFINLGIKLLKDKDSTTYLITTLISECLIIVISIIAMIVTNIFVDHDLTEDLKKKLTKKEMHHILFRHLLINYIMFLFLAMFNTSIITLVYLLMISILLIFLAKHSSIRKISLSFKIIAILIYVLIIIQIFLINLLNIYHFYDKLTSKTVEKDNNKRYYSAFTQIGINFYNTDEIDKLFFLTHWPSYLFIVISMLSLSSTNNNITFDRIYHMINKENDNLEKEENTETNCFIKLLIKIKDYFICPNFILHICRIFAIAYLYFFKNFFGIIVFIWLLFSFLFLRVYSNKSLTFVLIVSLLVSISFFHIGNIDGLFEDKNPVIYHLNLLKIQKEDFYYIYYFGINLFYFCIILFIYSLYESERKKMKKQKLTLKNQNKEELIPKIDLEENLLDKKDNIITDKTEENSKFPILEMNNEDNKVIDENEIRQRGVTFQILSKEEKPKLPNKIEINEELLKKLTLLNIITKAFYLHIDKISLIVMYFIAIYSINIIHSILVIIFMIQLLFPKLIEYISKYLIVIIQLLFFSEFAVDILKHYFFDSFNKKKGLIQLFMLYDDSDIDKTSVEIFIYGIVYCFYIQYQLYNNDFYKDTVLDKDINLVNYIEIYLYSYPTLKNIILFIGGIIIEIYIWILITLFIFFDSYYEISILFEIKLIIFLIIVFQFLISIQKSEGKHISLLLNWIFLIYCSLNTILVYGYQLLCTDCIDPNQVANLTMVDGSTVNEEGWSNLPNVGFTNYKKEGSLYVKFLPHFICNFISILFIWEMRRILLKSEKIDKDNKVILIKEDTDKEEKIENEDDEEDEIPPSEQYEKNKNEMNVLNISYYLFNIILIITKFYWLFLFLSIGIIFTKCSLSILLVLYIFIFGSTFIRMFYQIITKLTNFVSHKSFFISRLLRYNLIEQNRHILQNKYYRSLAFKYLLSLSFISYLLFYTYGLIHLFQKGCEEKSYCIFSNENEIKVKVWAYFIGFYMDIENKTVFTEGWYHLFFSIIISFDVYVQKIENYFNQKVEENRKRYKHLANENIKLKPLTYGEDNILMNIGYGVKKLEEEIEHENSMNEILRGNSKGIKENEDVIDTTPKTKLRANKAKRKKKEIMKEKKEEGLKFNIEVKNEEEDTLIGKKLIEDFLKIFEKAGSKDIKLSNKNLKYQIIKVLKKIFEEIIIFLLICTSISKMNVWSFIYMVISLILIITEKTMIRYYRLYCYMISSLFVQSLIFVSNIQKNTDPNINRNIDQQPNPILDILKEMEKNFGIPIYTTRLHLDDKEGFFYGLGVSRSQINLIWMEFIEIVIIYIYLDYFSYSIYQEANTIGRAKDKANKINYYNLYLNKETRFASLKLSEDEYKKHKLCMEYNFGVDILPYDEYMFYMRKGVFKSNAQVKMLETIPEELPENKSSVEESEHNEIVVKENDNINNDLYRIDTLDNYLENEKNKIESPLLRALSESKKVATTTNLMEKTKDTSKTKSETLLSLFKDFIYLSFHNVILIIIIIISMMISGFISIFYITYSLYFLITSTSIYLGNKYYYPRAIKTILRIAILLDITIQILYQAPYFNSDNKKAEEKNKFDFYNVLQIIGLNKILTFKKGEDSTYNVVLDSDQLFLVIAKAFTYLIMSFQILVYSSQSFQEYYLSYIITKNNILRRISLMNVFKFNNNRIEAMNNSINLRHDMSQSMNALKNKLEQWNANLMMAKADGRINQIFYVIKPKQDEKQNEKIEEKVEEENNANIGFNFINNLQKLKESADKEDEKEKKEEEKEKEEEIKEDEEEKKPMTLLERIQFMKKKKEEEENKGEEKIKEEEDEKKIEEKKEEEKKEEEEKKKEEEKRKEAEKKKEEERSSSNISRPGGFFSNLGLPINPIKKKSEENEEEEDIDKDKNKYLPEKEVFQRIRDWILGGFLIRLQIKLHKYGSNYTNIEQNERPIYERDTIQGKTKITSFIENMVEMQLNTLDLSSFTSTEMKAVKKYFDGTRAKELLEKRKEKEKKKKFKDAGKKIIMLNRLRDEIEKNKKEKEVKLEDRLESGKTRDKRFDTFTVKNKGVLEEVKKQQKKEQEIIIDLTQPKFVKLEKFISGKLFIKYLSKSYIIKSILKDILSFCSNNFHWLCYLMMIINHMMSSSLLTLFYPLSIFCYAILEYPRPAKTYWTICLVYTVILLGAKFVIHLEVFKDIEDFKKFITDLYNYKIGLRICESSFSKDFFTYILYDALVLIFLLINDYLLVSRGIWTKREQEIENIYQAMERIAKTKDLEINNLTEIRLFNNKYLENNRKKMTNEEKQTFRFSNLLLTDDLDENSLKARKTSKNEKSNIKIKELALRKTKKELITKEKTIDENVKRKELKKKKKELEEKKKKEIEKKKEEENKYNESKRNYFQKIIPRIRNEKPGDDYYASYTISMLAIILFILVFYTTMVQDKNFGQVELDTKQFSGAMVIALIIHVAILVYDRILYISQNRNNLKYDYILYDKETKIPLDEKDFNKIKSDISREYPNNPNKKRDTFIIPPEYAEKLKEKYNILYIQIEELNLPLLQKYILHIVIVIAAHIFIFFYCPMIGNLNIFNTVFCQKEEDLEDGDESPCNDFLNNKALIVCYWFYIIYFVSSGLQVKYGFHDMKRKSMLKSGKSSINGTIFNSFKAIPFLYEIKLAIDWTFTKTCLDIFQWNKFESVYDIVYVTYCTMTAKNQQLVGQKIGKVLKLGMGGALSFALVFILVAPLMLFSSLNPTNQLNNLTGATLKVDLSFVYKNKAVKNYTLFENSKPESIESIFKDNDDEWEIYNYSYSPKTKNFPRDQIQTVQFFNESDKNWDLARPHIDNLRELILNRKNISDLEYIGLVIDYNFDRPLPAESMSISKRYSTTIYYYNNNTDEENEKLDKLGNSLLNCYNEEIEYKSIYSPPIRLSANIKPKRLTDPKYFPNLDIRIGFVGCRNETSYDNPHDKEEQTQDKESEKEKEEKQKEEAEKEETEKKEAEKEETEKEKEKEENNNENKENEKYILKEKLKEGGEEKEDEKEGEKEGEDVKEGEKEKEKENERKVSYLESYFTFQKVMDIEGKKVVEGIKFHVFSDQVSTTTSGKNILTFYVSFVLLVGTYVRNFFAGQPEKIMLTEMPHSEEIINLCEGIQVSRNSFDFEQEEKLYYILIELMRSPDYLRTLTLSSTEQFKQRQELTRAYKTSDNV